MYSIDRQDIVNILANFWANNLAITEEMVLKMSIDVFVETYKKYIKILERMSR